MQKTLLLISNTLRSATRRFQAWRMAAFTFALGLMPAWAYAGVLSAGICRPYRQLVDNELFVMLAVISAVVLVIVWKMAPSGTILARGVGLLAALVVGLNIENILQAATGTGIAC